MNERKIKNPKKKDKFDKFLYIFFLFSGIGVVLMHTLYVSENDYDKFGLHDPI